MACNKLITADILYDCDNTPIKGLDGQRAVLINMADIDFTATTQANGICSALTLKAASVGKTLEWYKELGSVAAAYSPNAEDTDGFTHSFIGRLPVTSAANALAAAELKNGRFVVVVETSYKGTANVDAFKIYGLDTGLELSEMTQSSNENSGSLLFTLSTREGTYEKFPYVIYQDLDYTTAAAEFAANFTSIP